MSDLISRSDVLKLPRYNFGTSVSMLTLEEYIKVSDIKKILTAYSVDKIISQLGDYGNEEIDYYRNTPYENCIRGCVSKAIEIVKAGMKNE